MQEIINRMRRRGDDDRGFTMIELLVVVVIIGVLVAIAVPVYLNYRKGALNKSAASDVRGAVTAMEQYYTENAQTFPTPGATGATGASVTLAGTSAQTITVSPGNQLNYATRTAGGVAVYKICAVNVSAGQVYYYDSSKGGAVAESTQTSLANCLTTVE